jgi:hypothetical protein
MFRHALAPTHSNEQSTGDGAVIVDADTEVATAASMQMLAPPLHTNASDVVALCSMSTLSFAFTRISIVIALQVSLPAPSHVTDRAEALTDCCASTSMPRHVSLAVSET